MSSGRGRHSPSPATGNELSKRFKALDLSHPKQKISKLFGHPPFLDRWAAISQHDPYLKPSNHQGQSSKPPPTVPQGSSHASSAQPVSAQLVYLYQPPPFPPPNPNVSGSPQPSAFIPMPEPSVNHAQNSTGPYDQPPHPGGFMFQSAYLVAQPQAPHIPYPSVSAPSTPPKGGASKGKGRGRASSLPSTSSDPNNIQCSGITKTGNRCTRTVKSRATLSSYDPDESIEPFEVFCFQHIKEVLSPTGFRSRKGDKEWVKFDDYIPSYLSEETKVALRVEMEKPPSEKDVDGYIYCFEILNDTTPKHVHLKVGRTNNLPKRVTEWSKQCGSHEQTFRGSWPELPASQSFLPGKLQARVKGPNSHRLERLIHLELADLVTNTPYLLPGFPKKVAPPAASGSGSGNGDTQSTPTKKPKVQKDLDVRMSGKTCPDCGSVHREIFTFAKATKGKYKGKEWDLVVQPAIAKWGKFVEQHV